MKNERWRKDLDNVENVISDLDKKDYTDPWNREDRIWLNMYLIERQLTIANWWLFAILVTLLVIVR